jgi:hypothetical protein
MMDKESQPIDELFKKTFDSLPDGPSPAGWDMPSDRVWQNIKGGIPQPGMALGAKIGVWAAVVLTAAVATYWVGSQRTLDNTPLKSSTKVQPSMTPSPEAVAPLPQSTEQLAAPAARPSEKAKASIVKPNSTTPKTDPKGKPVNSRQAEQGAKPGLKEGEPLPEKH